MKPIDPNQFVEQVAPLLAKQDLNGLCTLLKTQWQAEQLQALLRSQHTDAKKVALVAMALVGKSCCIEELAHQLKDPDIVINQLAEHALWSVWLRGGTDVDANHLVCRGNDSMNQRAFDQAIDLFSQAIRLDPNFAEAYNQRAIGYYLKEDFQHSIGDCKRTIRRMPCHFGAWAGMGHCHAHRGELTEAIACYEKALEINPHLDCVAESLTELRRKR